MRALPGYGWMILAAVCAAAPPAWAVVGQAESYDEFKQQDLDEFQQNLVREERLMQEIREREEAMQTDLSRLKDKEEEGEAADEDLEYMRRALLEMPKRDRFRIEATGDYVYESNVGRVSPRRGANDDSLFDTGGTVILDLSGKRTDLRLEGQAGKHWSKEFPEGDFYSTEGRIRFRRRFFKKIQNSYQFRVARTSSKTIEIDQDKVRYDIGQVSAYNFGFFEKLALNLDLSNNKRLFTQEAFDQDSSWEVTGAPSAFWYFTPKSRLSLGYRFGANRIRTKTGDTNSHEVAMGYFGRVTGKSSISFDVSAGRQNPRSTDTARVKTYSTGLGYLYQMTPKTQMTLQLLRSIQNSTSDLVSGSLDGENSTTKTDTHFVNNSVALSLNSRLTQKLSSIVSLGMAHVNTKTTTLTDEDRDEAKSTQYTFPLAISVSYVFKRWMILTLGYTFSYRTGYEQADLYRNHNLRAGVRFSF